MIDEAPILPARKPLLEVRGIAKRFADRDVLGDVSLSVNAGEFVAIVGESGAGKSTLLNIMAGLERPDRGEVMFDSQSLATLSDDALTLLRRQKIGFVFQAFHVLPYLSVARNVALPLTLNGADSATANRRAAEMLTRVGLAGREASRPAELSGGELQRVAIARALVHQPLLVLADEPTGNLDPENAAMIFDLLQAQITASGAAGVLVTHSMTAAARAHRALELTRAGLKDRR